MATAGKVPKPFGSQPLGEVAVEASLLISVLADPPAGKPERNERGAVLFVFCKRQNTTRAAGKHICLSSSGVAFGCSPEDVSG